MGRDVRIGIFGVVGGVFVLVIGAFFGGDLFGGESGIRVASFNGEVFGDAKVGNVGVDYYASLISGYDLFFLLEIRDIDGSSFWEVCSGLNGYDCYLSNRSGQSRSKEAVGVFVRKKFDFDGRVVDAYPLDDSDGDFERVPVYLDVDGVRYFVVHLSPENVYREMESLEGLVTGDRYQVTGPVVVMGDMNADCDYYDGEGVDFLDWNWVIPDDADTASGFGDCAYDRVIVSEGLVIVENGVVEIDSLVSDHNLVWFEIGGANPSD